MLVPSPQIQYQPIMAADNGIQNMQQPIGYMRTLGAAINNQNTIAAQAQPAASAEDQSSDAMQEKTEGEKLDDQENSDSEKDDQKLERKMEVAKTSDNYDDDESDSGRSLQNRGLVYNISVVLIMVLMLVVNGGW